MSEASAANHADRSIYGWIGYLTAIQRLLSGYDVFISYARRDSSLYAECLAKELRKSGYAIFLDRTEAAVGRPLSLTIQRALNLSRTMVLVCSDGASSSPFVSSEIAYFLATDRSIVTINVDNALQRSPWAILRERIFVNETAAALTSGCPSSDILDSIENSFRLTRRSIIRRRAAIAATAAAVVLLAAADWTLEGQRIDKLKSAAQTAIDNQDYERAIKVALRGLPVEGDFFWRRGWSSSDVRGLLAMLAGSSQMSAYVGQLKNNEYLGPAKDRIRAPVQTADFDPKGVRIVTASQAGTMAIWDSRSRAKLLTCSQDDAFAGYQPSQADGSTIWVRDARFGPSDETVLGVGRYGAWIWSPNCEGCSGKDALGCQPKVRMIGHQADVRTGAFSPDWTKVLTTSDDEKVFEWDAQTGAKIGQLELPDSDLPKGYRYSTGAQFSPDGKSIVVGRRDGLIAIVDAQSRQVTRVLQKSGAPVWSVNFDRPGERVLSSSGDGRVVIWDVPTGKPASFFRQASGVGKSVFSPDQRYILTTSLDNVARIWDVTTLQQIFALKGHTRSVLSALFSPDGKQIITTSDDGTARVWNIGTSILPMITTVSPYPITSSALSDDGKRFVVATLDNRITTYDVTTNGSLMQGEELRLETGEVTSLSFGLNSKTVIIATNRGAILQWKTDSNDAKQIKTLPKADSFVAYGLQHSRVATVSSLNADQYRAEVTSIQTGQSTALEGASLMTGIEFDRSGNLLAGGSNVTVDGQQIAFVWDAKTGRKVWELKNSGTVLSAHFSRDGTVLATSTIDRKAYVWDLSSGRRLQVFTGHTYDINSARLSSDGKRLVTASSDRTVRVWDIETATPILQFSAGREANDAFFSSDGEQIIVVTASGDILIYDVSWTAKLDKTLKDRACAEKLTDIDEDGVCSRVGPFSSAFWRRMLESQ